MICNVLASHRTARPTLRRVAAGGVLAITDAFLRSLAPCGPMSAQGHSFLAIRKSGFAAPAPRPADGASQERGRGSSTSSPAAHHAADVAPCGGRGEAGGTEAIFRSLATGCPWGQKPSCDASTP